MKQNNQNAVMTKKIMLAVDRLMQDNEGLRREIDELRNLILSGGAYAKAYTRANGGPLATPDGTGQESWIRSRTAVISVFTYHFNISTGIYRQLPNYRNFKYLRFWRTNINGMLAMEFLTRSTGKDCVPISKMYNDSGWQVNGVNAVNMIFGGVAVGKPFKPYNAELYPDKKNTFIIWPATLAFALGGHKIELISHVVVDPVGTKEVCVKITTNRMRFYGVVPRIGKSEYDSPFVTVTPEGKGFIMVFSDKQSADCYEITPVSGSNRAYEICSLNLLRSIGYGKGTKFTVDFLDDYSIYLEAVQDDVK